MAALKPLPSRSIALRSLVTLTCRRKASFSETVEVLTLALNAFGSFQMDQSGVGKPNSSSNSMH
jgi:hypothetical protein